MPTPRVYLTRRVHDEAIDILKAKCTVDMWDSDKACPREELLKKVKGVDAIFCTISDLIDNEVLDAAGPQLKIIASMSVGLNHISEFECRRRNIYVSNTPSIATDCCAEFTVTLLLVTARRCLEGAEAVQNGEWGLWKPMWICGTESLHRTLGIIGMGKVGFGVARRMKPFGMERMLYSDISRSTAAEELGVKYTDLETLARESDYIVVTAALTGSSKHLINKALFDKMKPSAVFVNTSRGPLVDTDALVEALQKKKIAAAGLDVTDPEPLPPNHPLVGMDNCVITPHLGTNSSHARLLMAKMTAKNIVAMLSSA